MMIRDLMVRKTTRSLALLGAAATLSLVAFAARAQENAAGSGLTIRPADPTEKGDGTLSPAAAAAIAHGPLPFSDADVAAKAAANRARDKAEKSGARRPFSAAERAPAGAAGPGPLAPSLLFNGPGLSGVDGSPPDTTGAIGPTRFVQLVNSLVGILNRTTGVLSSAGPLNQLAGIAASVNSFDPQIIWDPMTNRFYYTMASIFSASDNRLSFGFSKTPDPNNVTTDWCHYTLSFGAVFPDFPKLGDSQDFAIIGVNSFNSSGTSFLGSDLIAISKPAAGPVCPAFSTLKIGTMLNLMDSGGQQVVTPVPANQIDTFATGFVVARNGALPSNQLWFFNVTKDATGAPVFGPARGVTVGTYDIPAAASQPVFTQVLDTLDARNTQAVQATDPRLGTFSFWTQHTIANGTFSAVRWYEIDPVPATPVVLRSGDISFSNTFLFNAAISPDRRVDGAISAFGNNFVIEYNVSGKLTGIDPRINSRSSVNGGPLSFLSVMGGAGPYQDFTCQAANSTCRWGDYSAATPNPRPSGTQGVVWGTNQFSGLVSPPANGVNWRTRIFALKP